MMLKGQGRWCQARVKIDAGEIFDKEQRGMVKGGMVEGPNVRSKLKQGKEGIAI